MRLAFQPRADPTPPRNIPAGRHTPRSGDVDDRAHSQDVAVRHTGPFTQRPDEAQRAGTYTVQTHEETLPGLSFLAWRRTATLIFLPSRPGGAFVEQLVEIDPWSSKRRRKEMPQAHKAPPPMFTPGCPSQEVGRNALPRPEIARGAHRGVSSASPCRRRGVRTT